MKQFCISLIATASLFCGAAKAIDFPEVNWREVVWTKEELVKPIAVHRLSHNAEQTTLLIRLMGKETPHYHDNHDLSIKVLAGESVVHLKNQDVRLAVGDELLVPKGILHWAENQQSTENIVLVVFNPGLEGQDKREANE
jgi:quercetin dioxygenase-like cupin family protein